MPNTVITFLAMKPDDSVEAAIDRWVDRIEYVATRFEHCEVTITHRAHAFEVELAMTLVGIRIVVPTDHSRDRAHENVYVAVSDAFRGALQQIHTRLAIGTHPPYST